MIILQNIYYRKNKRYDSYIYGWIDPNIYIQGVPKYQVHTERHNSWLIS